MSEEKIRITDDDLKTVSTEAPTSAWPAADAPATAAGTEARQWGTVTGITSPDGQMLPDESSAASFLLKSWVYLGLAGLVGAFLAWAICEPGFVDGDGMDSWGNYLLFPLLITMISLGLAIAESVVERSMQKALIRGALALVLGVVLGFIFNIVADLTYRVGITMVVNSGGHMSASNPALWCARALAWMAFGITGGVVYGIAGQSGKKCLFGVLGGVLGAGVGGFLFDPISLLTQGGAASRCIGMVIFGACTGIAIGLVESALKTRWLYVSNGPLAGKQFILYKPVTQIGSQQSNDIYLFKDTSISALHASIRLTGAVATLFAAGATYVNAQPASQRTLRSGDTIQIGRYTFLYQEKKS